MRVRMRVRGTRVGAKLTLFFLAISHPPVVRKLHRVRVQQWHW
jgi:hypothetical protein